MKQKPLLTLALFAYNQEQYIEDALKGAFSQTYSPLEIILSDDASTDKTFVIMERMVNEYHGPHNIVLNQNRDNLGLIKHVNKVFHEVSKGEIIVCATGDDISLPDRVERNFEAFKQDSEIMSVSMDYQAIDSFGANLNVKFKCKHGQYTLNDYFKEKSFPILGCTRAYRREIFEKFGELDSTCGVEDVNLVFRALLLGPIFHLNEFGIKYRININSMSNNIKGETYQNILKQRILDLEKAFSLQIINKAIYLKISETNNSLKKRFHHLSNFVNSNQSFKYYCRHILFSKNCSLYFKKTSFKSIIKSNMCRVHDFIANILVK